MDNTGKVFLAEAILPEISPGVWTFEMEQNMVKDGKQVNPDTFTIKRKVTVDYTVYEMPVGGIVNRIPLPDTKGSYTNVIPHVIIKDPRFPWYAGNKERPGIALLMFEESELEPSGGTALHQASVRKVLAKEQGVLKPAFTPKAEETMDKICSVLKLSTSIFDLTAPRRSELPLLAHCRQVYIGDKAEMELHPEGMFSVVLCNRLAEYRSGESNRYHMYLVSLEGYGDYLEGNANASGCEEMELIVLDDWSFEISGASALTFRQFAAGLPAKVAGGGMLRLASENEPRLKDGFVPLLYHTRTGDEGMCWYRSPLTPVVVEKRKQSAPYYTSDAALIYDRSCGVFDTSLSAAWECGRMAALQDQVFSEQVMVLRKKAQILADEKEAVEQEDTLFPDRRLHSPEEVLRLMMANRERIMQDLQKELQLLAAWLGRLNLLYQIPFHYLIPHPDLLPAESMRFFYIDENWLAALTDGAISVGMDSTRQRALNQMLREELLEKTMEELQKYRAKLYGETPSARKGAMSGFLIRSGIAAYWPTLSIQAEDKDGQKLAILRMQLLSPYHLLAIFDGVADQITCEEPLETIQMKVEPDFASFRENSKVMKLDTGAWNNSVEFAHSFMTLGDRVVFKGGETDGNGND